MLAVATDVLNAPLGSGDLPPPAAPADSGSPLSSSGGPDETAIARIAALLADASRPLVLAGLGASSPVCRELLVELARRTGALVGTTLLAKGLFRGCPYDLGVVGGYAADPAVPVLGDIDLVVAFGASLNPYTTAQGSLFRDVVVVQVDRDPARIAASPADVGVVADAELTARHLLEAVRPERADAPLHREEVLATLAQPCCAGPDESTARELDPRAVATALDTLLPEDRVLVFDSGRFTTAPGRFIRVREPGSIRHTAEGGSIGLGLGVALGAAIGRPERATVLFAGDGGFSMSLAELETAVRHGTGLIAVIMDDGAYGSELRDLAAAGLPAQSALLPRIDFAAVARALGLEAVTVHTADELAALGPRLRDRTTPLLVHCHIRRDLVVPRITWDHLCRGGLECGQQPGRRNRQVAEAVPRGVVDRVADCRNDPDHAELPNPTGA